MWDRLVARDWALDAARGIGQDANDGELGDDIWASAGALYFAADTGTGLDCRASFIDFMMIHVGWDFEAARGAADEVEAEVESRPPPQPEVPAKPATSRFRRPAVV